MEVSIQTRVAVDYVGVTKWRFMSFEPLDEWPVPYFSYEFALDILEYLQVNNEWSWITYITRTHLGGLSWSWRVDHCEMTYTTNVARWLRPACIINRWLGTLGSQLEREWHHLSLPTQSDGGQHHAEQQSTYLTQTICRAEDMLIPLSVLANVRISSPIPHASQGRSPVRPHIATYHCAPPGHQQATRQATELEAITSNESDDDRRSWFREVVVFPTAVG